MIDLHEHWTAFPDLIQFALETFTHRDMISPNKLHSDYLAVDVVIAHNGVPIICLEVLAHDQTAIPE